MNHAKLREGPVPPSAVRLIEIHRMLDKDEEMGLALHIESTIPWHLQRDQPDEPEYLTTDCREVVIMTYEKTMPLRLSSAVSREASDGRNFLRWWRALLTSVTYSDERHEFRCSYKLQLRSRTGGGYE